MSEKVLYTAFLLVVGTGYLMAMAYLYTSHQGHDGQPGLSIVDIAENYYGNRSGTRLEAAIRGTMSAYIQIEDRHEVVAWLKGGADQSAYTTQIQPILEKTCTAACHNPNSGLQIPDLTSYESVREVAQIDTGESLHTLMRLSHIHLFGIGLLLFSIGLIVRFVVLLWWLKLTVIVLPFVAVFADILAWFLTKWDPIYAYVVVTSGALLGLSIVVQILISLFQIWFLRRSEDGEEAW
jgi:hypothetical protein